MKNKLAFIVLNLAAILLITGYVGGFIITDSQFFDYYYAIATSAGIALLLLYIFIVTGNWGVIPVASLFVVLSFLFFLDSTVFDYFIKTKGASIIIALTSILCYLLILFNFKQCK